MLAFQNACRKFSLTLCRNSNFAQCFPCYHHCNFQHTIPRCSGSRQVQSDSPCTGRMFDEFCGKRSLESEFLLSILTQHSESQNAGGRRSFDSWGGGGLLKRLQLVELVDVPFMHSSAFSHFQTIYPFGFYTFWSHCCLPNVRKVLFCLRKLYSRQSFSKGVQILVPLNNGSDGSVITLVK